MYMFYIYLSEVLKILSEKTMDDKCIYILMQINKDTPTVDIFLCKRLHTASLNVVWNENQIKDAILDLLKLSMQLKIYYA